ncbi:YggS family pyridoxal phosphate-dependent enzyme [candidate division KSB3 bacterium]|uniref:Pyridoxal phosphate homeostasis protein n=1 Tax=candidate division KSB3 bacterium TaxID=2044937 RepID=A0A2G6KM46_9BACT|nr:MAG: YggS family pyridoxal phosphate-dependent enzyme [candidate division KSB3 bacterium]
MSITENFRKLRQEIPEHVTIVLAAKTRTPEEVEEAIAAGATDIGENYVQEAEAMFQALGEKAKQVKWHMIGTLQKNKINKALPMFDIFQTVDSLDKAVALNKRAARLNKELPVYIEVNIGGEASKSGMPPEYASIEQLVRDMAELEYIRVEGLMTMGPMSPDPEESRPYYRDTKKIFDKLTELHIPNISMNTLSMGMSGSYKVAVEEGSTMVRLGTIVFGSRQYT